MRAGDEVYRVRQLTDGTRTCTCAWWARHRGGRGPCRHAIAAAMVTAPVGVTA
ncbi:SWIM zinc finger family protein [Micromonospora sp. Llam0]|uniref:SWIM zinc finger family protein n=1 Tax=Micromonospora sp. Llam0 TaxID=2485143 RepID=UPI001F4793AF|nr:SWIM zinc finger family protein [Micromonospora sp. Llam0]